MVNLNSSKNKPNINKSNINQFINPLTINSTTPITIQEIMEENTNFIPFLPGYLFTGKNDINIVNQYFLMKIKLNNLNQIRNSIVNIINTNKTILENIKISREKYNLNKKMFNGSNNLIFNLKNNINNTFNINNNTFPTFVEEYKKNNFSIIKNNEGNAKYPLFYSIFQNNKFENNDFNTFFIKLFNEYIIKRNDILNDNIIYCNGLLSYDFIFELNMKYTKFNQKISPNSKNNSNLNKYIIQNKNILNSSTKKTIKNNSSKYNFKENDRISPTQKITTIDLSKTNAYTVENKTTSTTTNLTYNQVKNIFNKHKTPILNQTLSKKIDLYNIFYKNIISQENIVVMYNQNINKIFTKLYDSINGLLDNSNECNLYTVIVNNINLEYYLIKLIYYFNFNKNFLMSVTNYYKTCEYISSNINSFEMFYPSYIDWYNQFFKITPELTTVQNYPLINFDEMFEHFIYKI